jgi:hypothetical protein
MSETVTIGSASADIYGTMADATAYMTLMLGAQYVAWLALEADDKKRSLVGARRYIDRFVWIEEADDFAKRDAIEAFEHASYELAAWAASDASVLSKHELGSNIQSVNAGGAGVTYFNPTSSADGSAPELPPIIEQLIGGYLASWQTGDGAFGQSGSCVSPFSDAADYDRSEPH